MVHRHRLLSLSPPANLPSARETLTAGAKLVAGNLSPAVSVSRPNEAFPMAMKLAVVVYGT